MVEYYHNYCIMVLIVDFDNKYVSNTGHGDHVFVVDRKWVLYVSITEIWVTNMIFKSKGGRLLS